MSSQKILQRWHFSEVSKSKLFRPEHYSWDNSAGAIRILGEKVKTYILGEATGPEAYIAIDDAGKLFNWRVRPVIMKPYFRLWKKFFQAVKLKNVDVERAELINTLQKWYFSNPVNQYEMEMFI